MKKLLLITTLLFVASTTFGQQKNNNKYQLYEGEEKYPKLQRYVFLDEENKKDNNISNVSFVIGGEIFKYIASRHNRDTVSVSKFRDLNFSTIEELKIDEYQEHKKRTKEAGIKMPPPPNHYNVKVYIVEKICGEKAIKYEVDWLFTIH